MQTKIITALLVLAFSTGCIATAHVPDGDYGIRRAHDDTAAMNVDVGFARADVEVDIPGSTMLQGWIKQAIGEASSLLKKLKREAPTEG